MMLGVKCAKLTDLPALWKYKIRQEDKCNRSSLDLASRRGTDGAVIMISIDSTGKIMSHRRGELPVQNSVEATNALAAWRIMHGWAD